MTPSLCLKPLLLLAVVSLRSVLCLDWLIDDITEPVSLSQTRAPSTINGSLLHLSNGLIRRSFAATPGHGWATVMGCIRCLV